MFTPPVDFASFLVKVHIKVLPKLWLKYPLSSLSILVLQNNFNSPHRSTKVLVTYNLITSMCDFRSPFGPCKIGVCVQRGSRGRGSDYCSEGRRTFLVLKFVFKWSVVFKWVTRLVFNLDTRFAFDDFIILLRQHKHPNLHVSLISDKILISEKSIASVKATFSRS